MCIYIYNLHPHLLGGCADLPFGGIHFEKSNFCVGLRISPFRGKPFSEISLLWRCADLPLRGEPIFRNLTFMEVCGSAPSGEIHFQKSRFYGGVRIRNPKKPRVPLPNTGGFLVSARTVLQTTV